MATNFFGPVTIGTKVTVEQGATYIRTKVEQGATYNEYSHGKEEVEETQKPSQKVDAEMLKRMILGVSSGFKCQNHWFAVVKPLMWKSVVTNADYDAGVKFVYDLMGKDAVVPPFKADDLRKMDCMSMSRTLDKWIEDDAPIKAARFLVMKSLTTAFWNMIENADLTAFMKS